MAVLIINKTLFRYSNKRYWFSAKIILYKFKIWLKLLYVQIMTAELFKQPVLFLHLQK